MLLLNLYYLFIETNYVRFSFSAFITIVLIIELILKINKELRHINSFLTAILNEDFTQYYDESKKGKNQKVMYKLFNAISSKYHNIRSEKEMNHLFLQTLIEQIDVGILSINEKGQIILANSSLRKLLANPRIKEGRSFEILNDELIETINNLKPGQQILYNLNANNSITPTAILASEFKLDKGAYKLISFQDIKSQLDEKEIEAWHKLIKTLTHEIMNSVTPITSLTGTLEQKIVRAKEKTDSELLEELGKGLSVIHERSKGLLHFTEHFRKLSKIPDPVLKEIHYKDFFNKLSLFFNKILNEKQIELIVNEDPDTNTFFADPFLLEQTMINLIKNSIESFHDQEFPKILINTRTENQYIVISVADNGKGIDKENLDQIFIPFYTTKDDGTGVGLSLSQQIIKKHGGTIKVHSVEGNGCEFSVYLPVIYAS